MDHELLRSAREGFVGSFKLAAMMVFAIATVFSAFINSGTRVTTSRHWHHSGFM